MHWFFGFFLVSGFCSLVYQVVWLRLAMASFGVTTPIVSLVLSLFMAGLGLGSWWSGRLVRRLAAAPGSRPLALYAGVEALIGLSALAAPRTMAFGRATMERLEGLGTFSSYALAALWLALAILPWTLCMGATFPFAMAAIRRAHAARSASSFSYLYVANLVGALFGTLVSAFVMIELLGFRGTLLVALGGNACLALGALALARTRAFASAAAPVAAAAARPAPEETGGALALALLFTTGLASLAMEVVWVRQFTAYLGTVVYAFAAILAIYLVATWCGSFLYRRRLRRGAPAALGIGWALVGLFGLLPLAAADPRWAPGIAQPGAYDSALAVLPSGLFDGLLRVLFGIAPFCATLGFLTPLLVDRWSKGDPDRAGAAYALNVLGSLIGPLVAGFVLLPLVGERGALLLLALPLFGAGLLAAARSGAARAALAVALAGGAACLLGTRLYEDQFEHKEVRHDATATVVATGEGMQRHLLVNGIGITHLTPVTKMMAHVPMAWRERPPRRSLVICFGMGTTFRSLASWGAETVGVELVPSVPELFGFFHDDAQAVLDDPRARVVVDDGRRFLERTDETFDVITLDPPPPPEAAGSSLLYSVEFNRVAKRRLAPGGILQQWCPTDEADVQLAIWKGLSDVFAHVLVFRGLDGWGFHFLASDEPLPLPAAAELAARTPPAARADLVEWGPEASAEAMYQRFLDFRVDAFSEYAERLFHPRPIEDDRPLNEYFFLRRLGHAWDARKAAREAAR